MGSPSARLSLSKLSTAGLRALDVLSEVRFGGGRKGVLLAMDVKVAGLSMSKCLRLGQLDNKIAGASVKLYSMMRVTDGELNKWVRACCMCGVNDPQ